MPYTIGKPPKRIKKLPKHAQEIWIAAYNSAYEEYDPKKSKAENREAYANSVAWGAVKKKYKKKADGKWVAKALAFNVAVVKTVIKNGQRRFFFTGSSDRIDILEERLDPSIFDDFVYNFERNHPGPIHVDIAHFSYYYPELRALVYTGEVDQLYRDGRYIKGWAFEYDDNPFSEASWEQLRRSAKGELEHPISCSLGFMPDYGNVGYENGVFTYRGGRNKAYIDHLAKTAFPANLDAEIVLEEEIMKSDTGGPTLAEDAQKVLGDPNLVEELEEARKKAGVQKGATDLGIVLKAEEEPESGEEAEEVEEAPEDTEPEEEELEEETEEEEEPELQPEAVKAATDAEKKAQQKRAKASGIAVKDGGNVTMPKKWSDAGVPDANTSWADWTNYKGPLHDAAHVRNASSRFAQDKTKKGYSSGELSKINGRIDKAKKKFKVGEYEKKAVATKDMQPWEYRPYGGATSIDEAQEYLEAAEDRAKVWDHWYLFQSVAENILIDEEIDDKRAEMVKAIADFKALLTTKSLLVPTEEPEAEQPEVKAETEVPLAEGTEEVPPPEEAAPPEVKAETEVPPSPEEQAIRVAKSFAEAAEMIITADATVRAKRTAMGEALVQTASAIEAVMPAEPQQPVAQPVDAELIVRAIEAGFERAMAKVIERMGAQPTEQASPPRPTRKSIVPPIQASAIITKGQTFGQIVDKLLGG